MCAVNVNGNVTIANLFSISPKRKFPRAKNTTLDPQRSLEEEFIVEFEGTGKDSDLTRWSSLTDIRGIEKEMLSRLDAFFETWLNP